MRMSHWLFVVGGLSLAGCGGGDRERAVRGDTGGMTGHMDSGGMSGMDVRGMQMMTQTRAHMDSMARMSPQQMQAMMGSHQAMVSQMMDRMGADMGDMKMSSTPEWTALTDSVKQDLAELQNLKGPGLAARMRAHADRVRRLITAHEEMMRGMH